MTGCQRTIRSMCPTLMSGKSQHAGCRESLHLGISAALMRLQQRLTRAMRWGAGSGGVSLCTCQRGTGGQPPEVCFRCETQVWGCAAQESAPALRRLTAPIVHGYDGLKDKVGHHSSGECAAACVMHATCAAAAPYMCGRVMPGHTTHTGAAAGHRCQGMPGRWHGKRSSLAPLQWAGALHNGQTFNKGQVQNASRVMPPRHNCPQCLECQHKPRRPHTADNSHSLSCYLLRCPLALPHGAAPHIASAASRLQLWVRYVWA